MLKLSLVIAVFIAAVSCNRQDGSLSANQRSIIHDSVQTFMHGIAEHVTREGPTAWLKFFDDSPDFFMVADGQLAFPGIDSAKRFINGTLVKTYREIELSWNDIRVVPLAENYAVCAAQYHETFTYADNRKLTANGYFTGVASHTKGVWKLQHAHWSTVPSKE